MSGSPAIGSAFAAAAKFTYHEIVSIALLSLAFWAMAALIVPLGGALIGLFEAVRSLSRRDEAERGALRTFVRATRENVVTGLPVSALFALSVATTALYVAIGIGRGSPTFLLGGLVGVYGVLALTVVSFRVAHVAASERERGLRAAFRETRREIRGHYAVTVLHGCVIAACVVVCAIFPVLLFVLLPGFLAVLEALVREELTRPEQSAYRTYLEAVP